MGLKITTIARLPEKTDRQFFVYFLDYGWEDELTRAMYDNFDAFAEVAADNRGLLMAGLNRMEFANEVLSWHHINNDPSEDLLPAIMITDVEPGLLTKEREVEFGPVKERPYSSSSYPEKFVLLPLREVCRTPADVTALLQILAEDLRSGKPLSNFEIRRVKRKGAQAVADMVVLQPNIGGVGVDVKEVFKWSRTKWAEFAARGRRQ